MSAHPTVVARLRKEYVGDDGQPKTWEVRGEDPNCDMGGPHRTPSLDRAARTRQALRPRCRRGGALNDVGSRKTGERNVALANEGVAM